MAAHAKSKQRVHTHKGVDFIVVPGSRREQVLLDLFQSEDRLADPKLISDDPEYQGWTVIWCVLGFLIGVGGTVGIRWLF